MDCAICFSVFYFKIKLKFLISKMVCSDLSPHLLNTKK
ncbi:MAG: hypothetical protein H6Q19_2123 [Bacteroidetes bacterium]|nr:hypothetical protein [Bacteroidota bacterium]